MNVGQRGSRSVVTPPSVAASPPGTLLFTSHGMTKTRAEEWARSVALNCKEPVTVRVIASGPFTYIAEAATPDGKVSVEATGVRFEFWTTGNVEVVKTEMWRLINHHDRLFLCASELSHELERSEERRYRGRYRSRPSGPVRAPRAEWMIGRTDSRQPAAPQGSTGTTGGRIIWPPITPSHAPRPLAAMVDMAHDIGQGLRVAVSATA